MHTPHSQLGYSLIETLVAVSILMLAIVAPMTIAIKSIQSSQYALEQNTAIFLAQEAISTIEALRNKDALEYINSNKTVGGPWDLVTGSALDPCRGADGCNFSVQDPSSLLNAGAIRNCGTDSCLMYFDESNLPAAFNVDGGDDTGFTRQVFIDDVSADAIILRVVVNWESHFLGAAQDVVMVTSFYNRYK